MTGRQHLDRRVSFMAFILGGSLVLWAVFLAVSDIGHVPRHVMAIPLDGLLLCAVYHSLMIRCPHCGRNIAHVTRSLTQFSVLRFPKRVRFCPHCMFDLEDEVVARR